LVIGLARSGAAAAGLLARLGARVDVTDSKPADQLGEMMKLLPMEAGLFLGGHTGVDLGLYQLAVISPGVPWDSPLAVAVRQAGIELISEIELAFRHISAPIIAITGANGKSTTTTLVGRILEASGKKVFTGGNLGLPLCMAAGVDYDWVVAEVSSFQLEGMKTFRPRISLITNITPDHLDRHKTMQAYSDLKARVFENQGKGDTVILNADDPGSQALTPPAQAGVLRFAARPNQGQGGVWAEEDSIYYALAGSSAKKLMGLKELLIKGPHNVENAMAAALAALVAGAGEKAVAEATLSFTGLPHRMELVACADGISFYNDSKGTNVDATLKSLAGFDGDVALIAGGSSKGADFAPLAAEIIKRTKGVALIGQTAPLIEAALGGFTPKARAGSMDDAVALAASWLSAGDSVLLSPACASFDMYKNYEDRGDKFRLAVARYIKEKAPCR
ncbi:MAG: UDP-N-acetylmuramoyl-L-alanine--D-glutamate ligase, partial [Nitrospinota bacterium]|nr:UDP-N-acetylmuramoyl-L-alanine--D-glutamate ligase [Nitrospinota bacterium]